MDKDGMVKDMIIKEIIVLKSKMEKDKEQNMIIMENLYMKVNI